VRWKRALVSAPRRALASAIKAPTRTSMGGRAYVCRRARGPSTSPTPGAGTGASPLIPVATVATSPSSA
jgi:hypothetical protein